jgi:L-aspartate oxidase
VSPSVGARRAGRAIVVGSGIAGLTAALQLGHCTVVTKTELGAGSSRWAQGGLAAALGADDAPHLHAADTVAVSGGLGDPDIADLVATDAPARVRWLTAMGTEFDRDDTGALALGREAGHRVRRIVHAGGDATGAEIMRALTAAVLARPDIVVADATMAVDLVVGAGRVVGITTVDADGRPGVLLAPAVLLATGGIGRLYGHTTNPVEATGDGLAMAIRVGARIRNPEFVQFHPTALASDLDPLPLLTEALRGEGALLVDASGRRYMVDEHPDAELAPRDIVARANWRARRSGPTYLDCRPIGPGFAEHFPTVAAYARVAGLDPERDLLPVTPAQHYHMGGVETDAAGRTAVPGLYACGEVASTGLHGANRLASNSLLEGLVFASRAAVDIAAVGPDVVDLAIRGGLAVPIGGVEGFGDDDGAIAVLRATMDECAGVLRDHDGLRHGLEVLGALHSRLGRSIEGRNLAAVAGVVLEAALARRESRGGHHRVDHPETSADLAAPTVVRRPPERRVPLGPPVAVPAA